jgi:hypothetical protein
MMSKLLDLAIAELRKLPPEDQDETAEMLLWAIETRAGPLSLDSETIAAIEEGLAQARRASSRRMPRSRRSGSDTVYDRPLYAARAERSDRYP